jgi:hypothetical protein
MVKLEGLPFNSSMISLDIWRFKKSIHTLQNNVHMFSLAYFVMGSHLGVKGTCHTSLCMKEGSLFVSIWFVIMRSTKPRCFRSRSWYLWKALDEEGCIGFVLWRLDLQCKSSWILNDFFAEE